MCEPLVRAFEGGVTSPSRNREGLPETLRKMAWPRRQTSSSLVDIVRRSKRGNQELRRIEGVRRKSARIRGCRRSRASAASRPRTSSSRGSVSLTLGNHRFLMETKNSNDGRNRFLRLNRNRAARLDEGKFVLEWLRAKLTRRDTRRLRRLLKRSKRSASGSDLDFCPTALICLGFHSARPLCMRLKLFITGPIMCGSHSSCSASRRHFATTAGRGVLKGDHPSIPLGKVFDKSARDRPQLFHPGVFHQSDTSACRCDVF